MQSAISKAHVSRYINEDELYWKNQLSRFRSSGLTKKEYCRQNSVSYDRFGYWMGKLVSQQSQAASKKLLPVQLKPELKKSDDESLFSVILKNGCILEIHNEAGLSIILEKLL